MKYKSTESGSLVLTVLIMMTAFVVIAHVMLRKASYLVLLAQEREKQ